MGDPMLFCAAALCLKLSCDAPISSALVASMRHSEASDIHLPLEILTHGFEVINGRPYTVRVIVDGEQAGPHFAMAGMDIPVDAGDIIDVNFKEDCEKPVS